MFTDPEFARVGLSETEAKECGTAYRLAKIPMLACWRDSSRFSRPCPLDRHSAAKEIAHGLRFAGAELGFAELFGKYSSWQRDESDN